MPSPSVPSMARPTVKPHALPTTSSFRTASRLWSMTTSSDSCLVWVASLVLLPLLPLVLLLVQSSSATIGSSSALFASLLASPCSSLCRKSSTLQSPLTLCASRRILRCSSATIPTSTTSS
eukprot:Mycagemm_TRINITY_DN8983_c0_g2::TRINITY_DN8983_c0_g2_i1::g.5641::m.5641 type:complete len:121 gc:universal TRINITY_DN8983_c0_g2_i1:487-849(+)